MGFVLGTTVLSKCLVLFNMSLILGSFTSFSLWNIFLFVRLKYWCTNNQKFDYIYQIAFFLLETKPEPSLAVAVLCWSKKADQSPQRYTKQFQLMITRALTVVRGFIAVSFLLYIPFVILELGPAQLSNFSI